MSNIPKGVRGFESHPPGGLSRLRFMERWPSGRRRTPGKCVTPNRVRGFESHPLRQIKRACLSGPFNLAVQDVWTNPWGSTKNAERFLDAAAQTPRPRRGGPERSGGRAAVPGREQSHPLRHFFQIFQYVISPLRSYWQNYWQIWQFRRWVLEFRPKAWRSLTNSGNQRSGRFFVRLVLRECREHERFFMPDASQDGQE